MWKILIRPSAERVGILKQPPCISAIKDDLGNTIHDEKLIADQLNKYFIEIGQK